MKKLSHDHIDVVTDRIIEGMKKAAQPPFFYVKNGESHMQYSQPENARKEIRVMLLKLIRNVMEIELSTEKTSN